MSLLFALNYLLGLLLVRTRLLGRARSLHCLELLAWVSDGEERTTPDAFAFLPRTHRFHPPTHPGAENE